ncbi:MAG TPA: MFS transporter [Marmoricola sp.]|jgi:UMF1 family MFS transporter|nr:MFS transporter [Nocardioidaceae bacterium]MCB8992531.1 MFS transporter [Nocardioidaceae bacterium]MCO5323623.1 MFS transporter [Nocardioidaceae bacterium]HRV67826.1 MFS transporter [Marmoricola sp.]
MSHRADVNDLLEDPGMERRQQQKAWNWYDFANSAFYTTVQTALFGPYMIAVAGKAAGCEGTENCTKTVNLLGFDVAAGGLPPLLLTIATLISFFVLPVVGAFVDRSRSKKRNMATFAWVGSAFAALIFFMKDDNWQIGAIGFVGAVVMAGCSLVAYYAILVDISSEEERDAVSSRGWAFGYIGGGLLLLINFVVVLAPGLFGIDKGMAARICLLSAAVWWAGFTFIPFFKLKDYPALESAKEGSIYDRSFGQLFRTLKHARAYPMTLLFLAAYLFYNDGIQTVIGSASTYGAEELDIPLTVLFAAILMIQFMAFFGAIFFGKFAQKHGSYKPIFYGIFGWMIIVVLAVFLPKATEDNKLIPIVLFLGIGVLIAMVMGGTQALSRSFFSLLIPRGSEGEYFGLYNAVERTSWLGNGLFWLMFTLTGSYRPAIFAIVLFFALGALFMWRLDAVRGIREAGNAVPAGMAKAAS